MIGNEDKDAGLLRTYIDEIIYPEDGEHAGD